jgi:glutamyl-tRNA reductase
VVGLSAVRALTLNHRVAGFDSLARHSLPPAALAAARQRLHQAGLEAVLLSTCNRTELYWHTRGPDDDLLAVSIFHQATGAGTGETVHFEGADAARHLLRVAGGLESLVLGEGEILAQVRESIESAEHSGGGGIFLPTLFHCAVRLGGRVRAETRIGQGALSVASAAVQLLSRTHPQALSGTVVVIGAGMTGRKVARHLQADGAARIVVLNRTAQHARDLAAELAIEHGSLDDLSRWLGEADAVLAAVAVDAPLLTRKTLRAARARQTKPLAIIDLSLPRAIDPDCAAEASAGVHDLSHLDVVVADHRALRQREVPRVEALLDRELSIFAAQARESVVRPLVGELRRHAESIRREELERARRAGPLDERALEHLTRRIVDRLLQGPSAALRRGDLALDPSHVGYLRTILGLANGMSQAGEGDEGP